jgi:6-phosphogluconolactonase
VLTPIQNSPFSLPSVPGEQAQSIAIDPTGSYLYVAGFSLEPHVNSLFGYTLSADGQPIPMQSGVSFPVGDFPVQVTVDAAGQFVYVYSFGTADIWVYSIESGTGYLSKVSEIRTMPMSQMAIVPGSAGLTFTPTQLYVTNTTGSGTITQFTIDPATGNLSNLSAPVAAGVNPQSMTTDPFGLYAYAGGLGSNDLSAYSISNTGLTPFTGNLFASGSEPTGLTTDLSGSYLYATMQGSTDHTVWLYDLVNGVPTNGQAVVDTDAQPVFMTNEPSGQYLYVANYAGHSINMFQINPTDGTLTPIGGGTGSLPVGVSQNWIAVDPSGQFAFSADPLSNTVWEFMIENVPSFFRGSLTMNGFVLVGPNSSAPGASSIAIEPTGKYLYATNQILGQIFAFTIDPNTGLLSPVRGTLSDAEVADPGPLPTIAVDISGKYLYCVYSQSPGAGAINVYSIDLNTGFLTSVGNVPYVQFAGGFTTTGTVQ